jgi:amidohydrolase
MSGTIRTFDPAVRDRVLQRFNEIVRGTAAAMGCEAVIDLQQLTPATINEPGTAAKVQAVARRMFPRAQIETGNHITMGSEDFAFFLEKVPGCFFFVGSANPAKGFDAAHHHPRFDIDEECLPRAAALMAGAVTELLK